MALENVEKQSTGPEPEEERFLQLLKLDYEELEKKGMWHLGSFEMKKDSKVTVALIKKREKKYHDWVSKHGRSMDNRDMQGFGEVLMYINGWKRLLGVQDGVFQQITQWWREGRAVD